MLIASVPIGMQFLLLLHLPTRCISGVFLFSRVIFNSFTSVSTVGHLLCYSHPSLCRMRAESGPDMYSLLTVNILCPKKRLLGTRRVLSHPCSRFPLISIHFLNFHRQNAFWPPRLVFPCVSTVFAPTVFRRGPRGLPDGPSREPKCYEFLGFSTRFRQGGKALGIHSVFALPKIIQLH